MPCQKILRNQFPHIYITLFHLSVFVSACISSSAVWGDQYFSEVSFHFLACLFPLPTSRILDELPVLFQILAERHICMDTNSIMQPRPILPPQLTQLGQQPAPHDSPNYPAAPCLVQLPQWAVLIYNRAYVTSSSTVHKHTLIPLNRKACIPPYVRLSCCWLLSSEAFSQLGLFSLKACHLLQHTHPDQSLLIRKFNHQHVTHVCSLQNRS